MKRVTVGLGLVLLAISLTSAASVTAGGAVDYNRLIAAIKSGQTEVVERGLRGQSQQDINLLDRSSLMAAAIGSGRPDMVKRLVEWGIDPNRSLQLSPSPGAVDLTPLLLAVSSNAPSPVVEQLITSGADPNKPQNEALPLHLALSLGHHRLARLLLERGARADTREPIVGMTTPMELAVGAGSMGEEDVQMLLRALIERGAPLSAQNKRGSSALHLAVAAGNVHLVRLLLEAGIDPNLRNARGETPLSAAQKRQRKEIADALTRAGAVP